MEGFNIRIKQKPGRDKITLGSVVFSGFYFLEMSESKNKEQKNISDASFVKNIYTLNFFKNQSTITLMLIDTHTHIADPEFDADRSEVIARAVAAGVEKMVLIGTDLPSSERAVALAAQYPFMWAAVGLHPHESNKADPSLFMALEKLADHPKVVGWGETGLDYYYQHSTRDEQRSAFVAQIRLAKKKRLPLVIHTREAWEETFEILENEEARQHAAEIGAVFHCFTGDKEVARRAVAFGFYLSFSGIVTFPKATALQESAAAVPLERILIETDAPYLSPQGFRGKRNEPAFVRETAEKIARLQNCSFETFSQTTSRNADRLFRLHPV